MYKEATFPYMSLDEIEKVHDQKKKEKEEAKIVED